jgi:hypothetical protein
MKIAQLLKTTAAFELAVFTPLKSSKYRVLLGICAIFESRLNQKLPWRAGLLAGCDAVKIAKRHGSVRTAPPEPHIFPGATIEYEA